MNGHDDSMSCQAEEVSDVCFTIPVMSVTIITDAMAAIAAAHDVRPLINADLFLNK